MRNLAIWCLWSLPASLALALIVAASVALSGGAMPRIPEPGVLLRALGLALPIQPLFWLVLAGWVALVRLVPGLESSWRALLPRFLAWFVSINTAITLLFYQGDFGLVGLAGFAVFGALLLLPRAFQSRLRPGAFHSRAAAKQAAAADAKGRVSIDPWYRLAASSGARSLAVSGPWRS